MSRTYWKVSVFDENLIGYVVKAVNLDKEKAKELVRELEATGVMARASKHKNPKGEYYYGK